MKVSLTYRTLARSQFVISSSYLLVLAQKHFPLFYSWVGGLLIASTLMLVGAWLVTRAEKRN